MAAAEGRTAPRGRVSGCGGRRPRAAGEQRGHRAGGCGVRGVRGLGGLGPRGLCVGVRWLGVGCAGCRGGCAGPVRSPGTGCGVARGRWGEAGRGCWGDAGICVGPVLGRGTRSPGSFVVREGGGGCGSVMGFAVGRGRPWVWGALRGGQRGPQGRLWGSFPGEALVQLGTAVLEECWQRALVEAGGLCGMPGRASSTLLFPMSWEGARHVLHFVPLPVVHPWGNRGDSGFG